MFPSDIFMKKSINIVICVIALILANGLVGSNIKLTDKQAQSIFKPTSAASAF